MSAAEAYRQNGFAHLPGFLPVPVANALLEQVHADVRKLGIDWATLEQQPSVLRRGAPAVHGYHYPPLITFLWGMTPAVSALTGCALIPTYSYLRIYRRGDICRVHADRPPCEHSLSLTLAYGDGVPWPLELGGTALPGPMPHVSDDFGDEPSSAVTMQPGDAVLYQGIHRRHGRTTPNPNGWSAHVFLHWVDPAGLYADQAFEGRTVPEPQRYFSI
jgi:hypothetical protein